MAPGTVAQVIVAVPPTQPLTGAFKIAIGEGRVLIPVTVVETHDEFPHRPSALTKYVCVPRVAIVTEMEAPFPIGEPAAQPPSYQTQSAAVPSAPPTTVSVTEEPRH